jgi:superfamily II DNA or RNA helicase
MAGGAAVDRTTMPLPPAALAALQRTLDAFEPRVRARGRGYAKERRIVELSVAADALTAAVEGGAVYEVAWRWIDGRWQPSCSCPVGPWCKHAYAVAWSVVRDALPRPSAPAAPPAPPRALLAAREPWQRQQAIVQLLGPAYYDLALRAADLRDILTEPDHEIVCWQLAARLAEAGLRVPPVLAPYRDREDLAGRHTERARARLRRDLVAWAERPRPVGERRLRLVLTLRRDARGSIGLTLEARLTSHRLTDAPRTPQQLQQLRTEVRAHPWLLSPEESALLECLTDAHGYPQPAPLREMLERFGGSSLLVWGDDVPPEAAILGGVVPGGPVRLRPEPARLLPSCIAKNGEAWLALRFVWPDGTERAVSDVLHFRAAGDFPGRDTVSLLVADGTFSRVVEEPPTAILERLGDADGVPIPAGERAETLARLAARYPHVATTVGAHTRFRRVTPVVLLDLRDDGWLAIRILAHAAPGWTPAQALPQEAVAFGYVPPGLWSGLHAQPPLGSNVESLGEPTASTLGEAPSPDDVWLELPDPKAVESVLRWLELLRREAGLKPARPGVEPGADDGPSWWLSASGRRLEALADAWDTRPPDVAFFGTERVRRLLLAPRAVPRIRVHPSGVDWLAVSAEWQAEGRALTEEDVAALRAATRRFVKLPTSGEWVRRDVVEAHDGAARVLADLGVEVGEGEQRLALWQLAGASEETFAALEQIGTDAETIAAVREMRRQVAAFAGLPRVEPPPGLRGELRVYQRAGLDFLAHASTLGIGAVLADDMGLGKTVQALAWIEHLRIADPDAGPSLVVCPASVVGNWAREAARFVPHLRVLVLGRGPDRHALRAEIAEHDLVVTNYALLRRDADEWATIPLRAAILDEAQNVKNPDAAVTRAALALGARHRLALTGTPLENRALDLWSIVTFANPGYLGPRAAFTARFDRPDAPPHRRALLAARLRPILLRRLKREVAPDLPDRIEERRDCELTPGQRRLYLAELKRSRDLVRDHGDDAAGLARDRIRILAALTRLRQICCHPALAGGKAALGSGKFDALFELLDPLLAEGHKVLVFSQFVRCLELLRAEMVARGHRHHMLTGETTRRDDVVRAFEADLAPCAFLLSLKAGGTGLNLTAASYVVLFDPWWNPAVEAQAIDRTHRIGQDRSVIAYRLVARGTIEERIIALQERKAAMVRDVLGEDGFARALTRADLEYLLARDVD